VIFVVGGGMRAVSHAYSPPIDEKKLAGSSPSSHQEYTFDFYIFKL
jgi:hypothetical protein